MTEKIELEFVDGDLVDWPVDIKLPRSVRREGRGRLEPNFVTRTCLVTFRLLPEGELMDLRNELRDQTDRLGELRARRERAEREGLSDDAEAAAEEERAVNQLTLWRSRLLRRVLVGLPANHGWDAIFRELPPFSPELVEAMADRRQVGTALESAYWAMLNGDKEKN